MGLAAFIAGRFSPLLNSPFRSAEGGRTKRGWLGERGEAIAAVALRAGGAKVLYRNFRAPGGGEVDLVARERNVLLFVEVKTRTGEGHGRPLEAVNRKKRGLIRRGAREWLRLLGTRQIPWRFDVVEVLLIEGEKPKVNWVKNAFGSDEPRARSGAQL